MRRQKAEGRRQNWAAWTAALLVAVASAGCEREQRANLSMASQAKYTTYQPNEMFADRASARPLVAGVVPIDPIYVPGVAYEEPNWPTGAPAVTRQTLENGQLQFNIFCAVCHGRLGNGEGMIVQRGFTRPPSYHIERLRTSPDSHYYDVISNGYGAMYSYGDRVPPRQRWEIIAYIRALQASVAAEAGRMSEAERRALIGSGAEHAVEGGVR